MAIRVIVNTNDGSVIPLEGTYLVTLGAGDDKERKQDLYDEWCEHGNDGIIEELGTKHGKNLGSILQDCGYGDITFGNSIAFSPDALRDEAVNLVQGGYFTAEEGKVLMNLTTDDCEEIASAILDGDYIWNVFREEVIGGFRHWLAEKQGGSMVPLDLI